MWVFFLCRVQRGVTSSRGGALAFPLGSAALGEGLKLSHKINPTYLMIILYIITISCYYNSVKRASAQGRNLRKKVGRFPGTRLPFQTDPSHLGDSSSRMDLDNCTESVKGVLRWAWLALPCINHRLDKSECEQFRSRDPQGAMATRYGTEENCTYRSANALPSEIDTVESNSTILFRHCTEDIKTWKRRSAWGIH